MQKSAKPAAASTQPASPAPVVLYVAVGPKRGLTGTGKGAYSNSATMQAFQALPKATTVGLPLAAYHECAAARNHKGFTAYAVKYHWLIPAPAAGSPLAVGPA